MVRKQNTSNKLLKKIISNAPYMPGVYMMLDKKQRILYIGKAKSLKKRLKSYLNNKDQVNRIAKILKTLIKIWIFKMLIMKILIKSYESNQAYKNLFISKGPIYISFIINFAIYS